MWLQILYFFVNLYIIIACVFGRIGFMLTWQVFHSWPNSPIHPVHGFPRKVGHLKLRKQAKRNFPYFSKRTGTLKVTRWDSKQGNLNIIRRKSVTPYAENRVHGMIMNCTFESSLVNYRLLHHQVKASVLHEPPNKPSLYN